MVQKRRGSRLQVSAEELRIRFLITSISITEFGFLYFVSRVFTFSLSVNGQSEDPY